ncbi:MAG: sulfotransferase, partial [Alphaproteobacteria bacterium]|nr:sulfotransferase [Alphaproteobacteria bacterium]
MTQRKKASFFIVGAPKCGTTALADFLDQHPQIAMLRKEMHHFGSDLQLRRQRPSRADYEAAIARLQPDAEVGDASVFYLRSEQAAAEIKAYNPQARIFILLRPPVEAMFSLHGQLVQMVDEDIRDFAQALAAEQDRRYGRRIPSHIHAAFVLQYRQMVDFAPQIKRYLNVFGREAVQVILQEDLKNDALA